MLSNPPTNDHSDDRNRTAVEHLRAARLCCDGRAPTSRVIAAIERAIELRELFDAAAGRTEHQSGQHGLAA